MADNGNAADGKLAEARREAREASRRALRRQHERKASLMLVFFAVVGAAVGQLYAADARSGETYCMSAAMGQPPACFDLAPQSWWVGYLPMALAVAGLALLALSVLVGNLRGTR